MFRSFFAGGFEGSTGFNRHRQWIDQIEATQHDRFADEDYALLREAGIMTVREAVRWPLVDHHRRYDFSTLAPFLSAAEKNGIEIIYDLFHFGFPAHIDLFSEHFPNQFADYCFAVADHLAGKEHLGSFFTPINEPSFFAWAAGDAGLFAPHAIGRGSELKKNLIRAAVAGIDAIRAAFPTARIVNVDPICRVVPPAGCLDLRDEARAFNETAVFESWDMLSGRLLPELGGSPNHLDIVGVNYYWTNQWELHKGGVPLSDSDPRRWPLRRLVSSIWDRYSAEIFISETGHIGKMRPIWLRELATEAEFLLNQGLPLKGICLYPILGMPEWHKQEEWTRMGLWDLEPRCGTLQRVRYEPMMDALRDAQRLERVKMHNYSVAGSR